MEGFLKRYGNRFRSKIIMIKNNDAGNVKKRRKADVSRTVFILSIITYPLLLFLVFYVYVNINSIVMAFTQSDIYGKTWFVGIENFKMFIEKVFTGNDLISQSIINSLKTFIINLVISLPLYIIFSGLHPEFSEAWISHMCCHYMTSRRTISPSIL